MRSILACLLTNVEVISTLGCLLWSTPNHIFMVCVAMYHIAAGIQEAAVDIYTKQIYIGREFSQRL